MTTATSNIKDWVKLGKRNPWIREATDPKFTERSFKECKDFEELNEQLKHGNWTTGQAFYLDNYCFIQQVNGGDEWLVIKDNFSFESITYSAMGEEGFKNWFDRVKKATNEQLKQLEY